MLFASSDNADSTRWPELSVTYTVPDDTTPCDANFSYTINTENINQIDFLANTINPDWTYTWQIENQTYTGSEVVYNTQDNNATLNVCLIVTDATGKTCQQCISINPTITGVFNVNNNNGINYINLYPNPTTSNWTLNINSSQTFSATLDCIDLSGRKIFSQDIKINTGDQRLEIPANNLSSGIYFLNIRNNTTGEYIKKIKALKK